MQKLESLLSGGYCPFLFCVASEVQVFSVSRHVFVHNLVFAALRCIVGMPSSSTYHVGHYACFKVLQVCGKYLVYIFVRAAAKSGNSSSE